MAPMPISGISGIFLQAFSDKAHIAIGQKKNYFHNVNMNIELIKRYVEVWKVSLSNHDRRTFKGGSGVGG
jgi:hypothetical protein